jgi:hypothetical protein
MDITKLIKPINFEAPPLGEVSIPVRTVDFLSWFDKARADGRWHDGGNLRPVDARRTGQAVRSGW